MLDNDALVKDGRCKIMNNSNFVERLCEFVEIIYEKVKISWVGIWVNNWYKYIKIKIT